MLIRYHPAARRELDGAAFYYEGEVSGLGVRFMLKYEDALSKILSNPTTYRKIYKDTRKLNLQTFPYGIIYLVDQNKIYILAVMHLHRRPLYWAARLEE